MIDAPWMAPKNEPYIVGSLEVCIVGDDDRPRPPTPTERLILDRYFASPEAKDEAGHIYLLLGEEVPGIAGGVVTYELPIT